jgi:hypothetical protein
MTGTGTPKKDKPPASDPTASDREDTPPVQEDPARIPGGPDPRLVRHPGSVLAVCRRWADFALFLDLEARFSMAVTG